MHLVRGLPALAALCALIPAAAILSAQTNSTQSGEISTKEAPLTFKSGVNLVPVPVVVRDSRGNAVGTLGVEDFQLFDNGKPQTIAKFTVEKLMKDTAPKPAAAASAGKPPASGATLVDANTAGIPDRFVAYLFDDLHMPQSDLVFSRDAALRQIQASSDPLQRTAVYTTSGVPMQEFTNDKEKLHAALLRIGGGYANLNKLAEQHSCPPMTYYLADQIINRNDPTATQIAISDAEQCGGSAKMVQAAAQQSLEIGDRDTAAALDVLRAVVMRMAAMAGQRTIVLVSPGFLVFDQRRDELSRLIERAIRANVVISGLDSRGIIGNLTIPDASRHGGLPNTSARGQIKMVATAIDREVYLTTEAMMQADVMLNLAEGTGGTFYHGTNDYDEGFARTAAVPDYIYVLGFSPLDLRLDGRYHNLKVKIKGVKGMEVQARKGYYAAKYATGLAEQANQQVEDALFSLDQVHDLPAILQTVYSKTANGDATLTALAEVDVQKLPFRKEGGRNFDSLTVVMGLFDNDGNYMKGFRKVVDLKLLDKTLESLVGLGTVSNNFTVHPGHYVIRMVVRDSEGHLMSEQSSLVEIP